MGVPYIMGRTVWAAQYGQHSMGVPYIMGIMKIRYITGIYVMGY
jgi:hypothetical protein